MLISDKSIAFASSLAGALRGKNASVALVTGEATGKGNRTVLSESASSLIEIPWNRSSALSVRTVLLEIKNSFQTLDQTVLVFDTPFLSEVISGEGHLETIKIVDEYIKGYMLLSAEVSAIYALQKKGRLVFVVRPESVSSNIALSVAEGAFMRLAEETAASFLANTNPAVQTLLVKLETANDGENIQWLVEQLEQGLPVRKQTRWVKALTRGLFGIL